MSENAKPWIKKEHFDCSKGVVTPPETIERWIQEVTRDCECGAFYSTRRRGRTMLVGIAESIGEVSIYITHNYEVMVYVPE